MMTIQFSEVAPNFGGEEVTLNAEFEVVKIDNEWIGHVTQHFRDFSAVIQMEQLQKAMNDPYVTSLAGTPFDLSRDSNFQNVLVIG